MSPTRSFETQCSHAQFLQELPAACGNRPYEIIGNQIIVQDQDREIKITVNDQPLRNLGSLSLPMEKVEFEFQGHTEEQADEFMTSYRQHAFRAGGG